MILIKWSRIAVGLGCVVLSLVAAYRYHFNHFYEVLVLGLYISLSSVVRLPLNELRRLYKNFIFAGLIGDLFFGLSLAKLWHYNYGSLWEYLLLYGFIYPVAGIVMAQSYIALMGWLSKPTGKTVSASVIRRLFLGSLLLSLVFMPGIAVGGHRRAFVTAFFVAAAASVVLSLAYRAKRHNKRSLVDDIYSQPKIIVPILLFVTYFNALLHELPNTSAHQWVYTNWPLAGQTVWGIPLSVLLLWPILSFYPVSVYYLVRPGNRLKQH